MSEYGELLSDLSDNITKEDLDQLKSACKEDIPEDQSNAITSSAEWFNYLEKNDKLAHGKEGKAGKTVPCERWHRTGWKRKLCFDWVSMLSRDKSCRFCRYFYDDPLLKGPVTHIEPSSNS